MHNISGAGPAPDFISINSSGDQPKSSTNQNGGLKVRQPISAANHRGGRSARGQSYYGPPKSPRGLTSRPTGSYSAAAANAVAASNGLSDFDRKRKREPTNSGDRLQAENDLENDNPENDDEQEHLKNGLVSQKAAEAVKSLPNRQQDHRRLRVMHLRPWHPQGMTRYHPGVIG